jgi:hypothetical protein
MVYNGKDVEKICLCLVIQSVENAITSKVGWRCPRTALRTFHDGVAKVRPGAANGETSEKSLNTGAK